MVWAETSDEKWLNYARRCGRVIAGVSLALATLYQAEKGLFEVPRAVDDPFPSRLNG